MASNDQEEAQAVVDAFLKKNGFNKTLKAFRKETKVPRHAKPALSLPKLLITKRRYDLCAEKLAEVERAAATSAAASKNRKRKHSSVASPSSSDESSSPPSSNEDSASSANEVAQPEPVKKKSKSKKGKDRKSKKSKSQQSRTDEDGDGLAPAPPAKRRKSKGKKTPNEPFRRVVGEITEVPEELRDNSYAGAFGEGGWGAKASSDLIVTRGKGFRHAKTKKKRGSYRGGSIDMGTNSFKFPSSDED